MREHTFKVEHVHVIPPAIAQAAHNTAHTLLRQILGLEAHSGSECEAHMRFACTRVLFCSLSTTKPHKCEARASDLLACPVKVERPDKGAMKDGGAPGG